VFGAGEMIFKSTGMRWLLRAVALFLLTSGAIFSFR
jgi:hypothetical protein